MKDLKHLIYFEDLLTEANNALVKQATADGKKALGYTCYFVPEVLLNLGGCFSVRLRAPGTSNTDIGTYYMTNKTCPFTRSILERSMEGGYNFLSAMLSSETCQMMHRAHEYFDIMGLVKEQNPDFFLSMMDVPFVTTKAAYEHYENQLRRHILEPLEKVCGVDISDKAIRAAIEEHNDICGIISELGEPAQAAQSPDNELRVPRFAAGERVLSAVSYKGEAARNSQRGQQAQGRSQAQLPRALSRDRLRGR